MSAKDPLIGTKMGDYSIQSLLGRGGMARVYKGYDENLDRYAAVKVIDAHLIAGDEREEYYARFQREARSIARLNHPNIVGIFQFGEVDTNYYMAMVFLEGEDLRQILKAHAAQNTFLADDLILSVITDMAKALDYAHKQGVIHRDVKPSNIVVTPDGKSVLTDFGLALSLNEGTIGNTFGSAHYIAPEQAVSSAQAVPQSDLYSLGIVLYEMLTGRVPFDDASAMSVALKHLSDPPPPPSLHNPTVSPRVEQVLDKLLSKEPGDRYQTGEDLVGALERAMKAEDEANPDDVFASWDADPTPITSPPVQRAPRVDSLEPTSPSISRPIVDTISVVKANENDRPRRDPVQTTLIGVVVVLLVATLVFLFWSFVLNPGGAIVSTPADSTAVAAVVDEETATAEPTEAPTNTPAATDAEPETTVTEAEVEPTATEPDPTATATEPDPTDTPDPPATEPESTATEAEPTATEPDPTATEQQAPAIVTEGVGENIPGEVILRYDGDTVVLMNQSEERLTLRNVSFVRTNALDREIIFEASEWEGGNVRLSNIQPGDCLQVWTTNISFLSVEDYCNSRLRWLQVPRTEWFWISSDVDANFEVRRNDDEVLAVCAIDEGVCEFSVSEATE